MVARTSIRLDGSDGAWVGTGVGLAYPDGTSEGQDVRSVREPTRASQRSSTVAPTWSVTATSSRDNAHAARPRRAACGVAHRTPTGNEGTIMRKLWAVAAAIAVCLALGGVPVLGQDETEPAARLPLVVTGNWDCTVLDRGTRGTSDGLVMGATGARDQTLDCLWTMSDPRVSGSLKATFNDDCFGTSAGSSASSGGIACLRGRTGSGTAPTAGRATRWVGTTGWSWTSAPARAATAASPSWPSKPYRSGALRTSGMAPASTASCMTGRLRLRSQTRHRPASSPSPPRARRPARPARGGPLHVRASRQPDRHSTITRPPSMLAFASQTTHAARSRAVA